MPTFTGTSANETITPSFVSPTVTASGAAAPTSGFDLIDAGGGDDVVEGGGGDDTVILGSGNDRFTWRRGDGNDVVEGDSGADVLRFLATDLNELLTLGANGSRARLTSSPLPTGSAGTSVNLDINAIERVELAIGGLDQVYINDLRGTGITDVAVEAALGNLNEVRLTAGAAAANFVFTGQRGSVAITGLGARVAIDGQINTWLSAIGGGGNDSFDASALHENVTANSQGELNLTGGAGNDTFILGAARERVDGGFFAGIDGIQLVDYRHSTAPVAVALTQGFGQGGYAAGDTYTQINGVIGSAFGDILSGGSYLEGLGGDDQLYGGFEATLLGGAGNDFLQGASNNDLLDGGIGNDTLRGGAGNDFLVGGAGSDVMVGGTGDDTYYVDDTSDQLSELAGEGNDRIAASIGLALAADAEIERIEAVNLTATSAMDLTGSAVGNVIYGNDGQNILRGEAGNDELRGFGGNDFLVGGAGTDIMVGGLGDDTFYVDDASDIIGEVAGEGNDRIAASVSFVLSNGANVEVLEAVNLLATTAFDLTGSDSANTITGNNGVNILRGEGGNDILSSAGGDDFLVGGTGVDSMTGGAGNDTYYADETADLVFEIAGEGSADRVTTAVSYALAASADVERLEAVTQNATNAMDLTGSSIANVILGNDGANVIDGKAGSDTLTGFGGADSFAFTTALGVSNVDTITGFVSGSDKILLENAIFTTLGDGALDANAFVTGSGATTAAHRIVYNNATGALFYDADGSGAGVAVQFATLQGTPPLAASDFTVI